MEPNFLLDLRQATTDQLDRYHVHYKKKEELHALIVKLYTFWDKYIQPQKRQVKRSFQLEQKQPSLPVPVQEALDKMQQWCEQGVDINGFQGRGLYGQGSRDYQNVLYGMVHLHLSAKKSDQAPVLKKDSFAKPSRYLLYAVFTGKTAYFLDVETHPDSKGPDAGRWTSLHFLEIMEQWPELLQGRKMEGAKLCDGAGNEIHLGDEELAELTRNHINAFLPTKQGAYLSVHGGLMASGDSMEAMLKADKMMRTVQLVTLRYQADRKQLHDAFAQVLEAAGRLVPAEYDLHFVYVPILRRFAVVDRRTGVIWDHSRGQVWLLRAPSGLEGWIFR